MADRPNDNDDESLTIVEDDKDHETGGGAAAAGGGGGHEHQLQLHQQQRKARRRKSSVESGSTDYRFVTLNPHSDEKSPLPSVDRLSVSFTMMGEAVDRCSSASSVRIDSPIVGASSSRHHGQHYLDIDDDDDEEYSISAQSILQQQRRRSGGKGRPGRSGRRGGRRPSSPFPGDELSASGGRRRTSRGYSVATISSAEMNVAMDDPLDELQSQQVRESHLAMHKEVVQNMRYQPWDLGRKLRILRRAKAFVREHEGALQQRLSESRAAKDVFARGQQLIAKAIHTVVRETSNLISFLVPWESRIKEIESLFGSAVASYFTFLRWVFWINLVLTSCYTAFVVVPEVLATEWDVSGERKGLLPEERRTATDLQTLWDFEGVLKYSPIFYGFYSNADQTPEGYKLPFAYFFTGIMLYIYSFVAILRKMAKNSRMAKLSDKEDECTFTWKLFTGWDFMIGHPETAENRRSAITLGFKEALLEEKEKERETEKLSRNVILRRIAANFLVLLLLCSSAYIVVLVVERSTEPEADDNWWRQNEITVILSLISLLFPNIFELIGIMEKYHPRKQLRWQLARIMILNMLNLYTLILALFGKVNTMTDRLAVLKSKNVSHLLDDGGVTTPMMNYTFNATSESSIYYNVTDSVIFVLNATQEPAELFEDYASSTTTFAPTSSTSSTTEQSDEDDGLEGTCFQVMVDCASLGSITSTITTTSAPTPPPDEEKQEDDDEVPDRSKRQAISIGSTASPTGRNSTPSITRLLDSLNAILRGLQRNTTRIPQIPVRSSSSASPSSTTTTTTTTTTQKTITQAEIWPSDDGIDPAVHTSTEPDESLDELKRLYTSAQLQVTTTEEEYTDDPDLTSVSMSTYDDLLYGSDTNSSFSTESTDPALSGTDAPPTPEPILLCPIIVCPWNDTMGHLNNMTHSSTTIRPEEDAGGSTLPCRGDNPQGCTTYWTSMRETVHSSQYSTQTREPTTPKPTLDPVTRLELRKLCWETMFGQEMVKLTIMDLVFTTISILIIDFFRSLFVRVFNGCWCWDLEKYFPQYGEFKIAENILHLVNNQGMIWMGMFFSPGLPAINIVKLFLLLYIRSWAVLTCNVPHEVIFRASRSNNFYLWLLLIMLFLCTLPVAYAIVWLEPSWHCGPFSDYARIFHVMTQSLLKATPDSLHWVLSYIASPGIVIPLLVLLILVIYYLVSLSSSLREAVTDLRTQLRRERDAERLKTRQRKEELAQEAAAGGGGGGAQGPQQPAEKIISQWRKAVPFVPNKAQQAMPQTLAKEAAEKRNNQHLPPAAAAVHRGGTAGQKETEKRQRAGSNQQGTRQRQPHPAPAAVAEVYDGSDLDISDSLPNDNCSPILNATGGVTDVAATASVDKDSPSKQQQQIYAVIKKKKPKNKPEDLVIVNPSTNQQSAKPRLPPKPAARGVAAGASSMATSEPVAPPPRSPANIPLIRISKTESVEQSERNPMPPEPIPQQQEVAAATGLAASSPPTGKSGGALNAILQRAKERRAASELAKKQQQQLQATTTTTVSTLPVSDSTADLLPNMETEDVACSIPEQLDSPMDSETAVDEQP